MKLLGYAKIEPWQMKNDHNGRPVPSKVLQVRALQRLAGFFEAERLAMIITIALVFVTGTGAISSTLRGSGTVAPSVEVATYHYDNMRTGWNPNETILSPGSVTSGQFNLLAMTQLDDQVDAQPLIATNEVIAGNGVRDVVYVATEGNTVDAVDASSGQILLSTNLGPPVPYTALPGQCTNNGPNVGITATPVIDRSSNRLYVVAYTYENSTPIYRVHALDLSTLSDSVPPVAIEAAGLLADGSIYQFNPAVSRQRAALLLSNGVVYAAFASFCDLDADQSRGWLLGWQASSLTPLAGNQLTNRKATSPNSYFLTSIWMSGYGLAASSSGDVFFVTGNSDFNGRTFNPVTNIAESVAQVSPDLMTIKSLFTPSNHGALDKIDNDFGSGGVMLIPPQPGAVSNLAVAAGKLGLMYLLNSDNLTNNSVGKGQYFGRYNIGGCWCGSSYYVGADGLGRVVSSGSATIGVWKIVTSPQPHLTRAPFSATVDNGQSPGFFTVVSSNGTTANSAVIWAVGHPVDHDPAFVKLYAFNEKSGQTLYSGNAGTWPNSDSDSNIVPVVANGKVYVAAYKSLAIFGLSSRPAPLVAPAMHSSWRPRLPSGDHEIFGVVRSVQGGIINVELRGGRSIRVDITDAMQKKQTAALSVGHPVIVRGHYDGESSMKANVLMHAKDNQKLWPRDR